MKAKEKETAIKMLLVPHDDTQPIELVWLGEIIPFPEHLGVHAYINDEGDKEKQ